jgi:hypothetical protein
MDVYVKLPLLLTSLDDSVNHALYSIYKIDIEKLKFIAESFLNDNRKEEFYTSLIENMNTLDIENAELLIQIIRCVFKIAPEISMDESYVDLDERTLNFDKIMKYEVDELGLVTASNVASHGGFEFYSQIEPEKQASVRMQMQDSDHVRCQVVINYVIQTLLFTPGYRKYTTATLIQYIAPMFMLLTQGELCRGDTPQTLSYNYVGYIIDLVVRSRTITYWQKYYIKDLQNYVKSKNGDSHLEFFAETDPKTRAQKLLNRMSKQYSALKQINFDEIYSIVNEHKIETIYGQFYNYPPTYMNDIQKSESLLAFAQFIMSKESKAQLQNEINNSELKDENKSNYNNLLKSVFNNPNLQL